jgi:YgiT-type zinc finger domain-containing protein
MDEGFQEAKMKCIICTQSGTVDELTSVNFERGEFRLVINNVPARVCPSCGEAYVDEGVALRLLQNVEDIVAQGIIEDVIEYSQ